MAGLPYVHAVVKETLRLHPSVPKVCISFTTTHEHFFYTRQRCRTASSSLTPLTGVCWIHGQDAKEAVHTDTLPDGTIIPAGAKVVYLPWVMGRMDRSGDASTHGSFHACISSFLTHAITSLSHESRSLWDNAMTFNPDRWLRGDPAPSHFKYTAFNAGKWRRGQVNTRFFLPINTLYFGMSSLRSGPRLCLGMNMAYLEAEYLIVAMMQKLDVTVQPGKWGMHSSSHTRT